MRTILIATLGIMLMLMLFCVAAASQYVPMNYPDLETAFKVPAWKTWQSPSTNNYNESLKVPTIWESPSTTNYTAFLKVPEWKTWVSPSTANYSASLKVPEWKSWKPQSHGSWDKVFTIPWH